MERDPRIDAYIERQAEFARPILEHLREAIDAEPAAAAVFAAFAPSTQRDYAGWITGAKRPATPTRRIAQAVAWNGEGKNRHSKDETRGRTAKAADWRRSRR